jgi:hypothetical protein
VLGDQRLELGDDLLVQPECKVAIDPVHLRGQPQLLEVTRLVACGRLELDPVEHRAAPERERVAQQRRRRHDVSLGRPPARIGNQLLEPRRVQSLRLDAQHVTGRVGRDRVGAAACERLAELRDMHVQRLVRRRRRRLPPERVDQPVARDNLACVQEQDGEQLAFLG